MRESQHCLLLVFSKFGASTNDIPVQRCKSPIVISFGLGLVKASETREQKSRFIRPADRVEGSPVPRKPITGNRVCVRLYCDTTCTWGGQPYVAIQWRPPLLSALGQRRSLTYDPCPPCPSSPPWTASSSSRQSGLRLQLACRPRHLRELQPCRQPSSLSGLPRPRSSQTWS